MSMKDFLAKANANMEKAKELKNSFGMNVAPGVYVGALTTFELRESDAGNVFFRRGITISEGDLRGAVAWDNMNINNEIGLSILMRFVELHGYDFPASLTEAALREIAETLINDNPVYRFRYTVKNEFGNSRIMEVIGAVVTDAANAPAEAAAPVGKEPATPADPDFEALALFCREQGVDVSDAADIDALKTMLADSKFPTAGVTVKQLKALGYDVDTVEPLADDQVELLTRVGLGELLITPEPEKPTETMAKSVSKPVPAKSGLKKMKK